MKFKIKCIRNGVIEYWNYDNVQNIVTDPYGNDWYSDLKSDNHQILYPANGSDTKFHFQEHINALYIVLGTKCNFHCKYCQQQDVDKNAVDDSTVKKVDDLIAMLKQAALPVEKQTTIILWGGEPLVYWKTIKKLIPNLRELFPEQGFSLMTNGSLLDGEKYAFFEKYNVAIGISYDGKHTLRDYPVFDNDTVFQSTKKALERKKINISVLPVINNVSDSPQQIADDLQERFETKVNVGRYAIAKCVNDHNTFAEYCRLSKQSLEELYQTTYDNFHGDLDKLDVGTVERFDEIRYGIVRGIPWNSTRSSCANHIGYHMSIDIDGNIVPCMNVPFKKYGNVVNWKNVVVDCFYDVQTRTKCKQCPYVNVCFGVCPLIKDENSPGFEINCQNYKAFSKAAFESALDSLYGFRTIAITAVEE